MRENLVSIIIPCYNAENYIGEAIVSSINQSYNPVEVIVVDDGSVDNSLNEIKSFSNIKYTSIPNSGVSAARNVGINMSNGKFVKFLDSDDILTKSAIYEQVQQLAKLDDHRSIVFGGGTWFEDKRRGNISYRSRCAEESRIDYILKVNPGSPFPLHRRSHLLEVGGFDESLPWAEDYDLHIRLTLAGSEFCYEPCNVCLVREHHSNDRLSIRKSFDAEPEGLLNRLQGREKLIRESTNDGGLPGTSAKILARNSWSGGREAVRSGAYAVAKKYFEYAEELSPDCVVGSKSYRIIAKLCGPYWADKIGTLFIRDGN